MSLNVIVWHCNGVANGGDGGQRPQRSGLLLPGQYSNCIPAFCILHFKFSHSCFLQIPVLGFNYCYSSFIEGAVIQCLAVSKGNFGWDFKNPREKKKLTENFPGCRKVGFILVSKCKHFGCFTVLNFN